MVAYLHGVGYDVIPVRPDLQQVDGLKSYAQLADILVQLDLAVIFHRANAAPPFVARAAAKKVESVWLPPEVWTPEAEEQAREHNVLLVKDRCIEEEHRHFSKDAGHPARLGVHVSVAVGRRTPRFQFLLRPSYRSGRQVFFPSMLDWQYSNTLNRIG